MSWNKRIFEYIYKRQGYKGFFYDPWEDMLDHDEIENYHWLMRTTWDYLDYGYPKSMKELGQVRLTTLLRLLEIYSAKELIDERGW